MIHPLKPLLEALTARSVGNISLKKLEGIVLPESISILRQCNILQDCEPQKTITCTACDRPHEITCKPLPDGQFLACCDQDQNAVPQFVQKNELVSLQIEVKNLLSVLAATIKADTDIKPIVSDILWEVGTILLDKRQHKLLFLRTDSSQGQMTFINTIAKTSPVIILSIHPSAIGFSQDVFFIDPTLIFLFKANKLNADSKKIDTLMKQSSQRITLQSNGDLVFDGNVLCNIPSHAIEYTFVKRLLQSCGQPVSHAELYQHCTKTHGIDSARTQQRYCNDYRSNITKLAKKAGNERIVNKIIISTKMMNGENAYKIANPIEKVTAK